MDFAASKAALAENPQAEDLPPGQAKRAALYLAHVAAGSYSRNAAGEFFGVVPGAPPLWTPTTNGDLDAVLEIEAEGVGVLKNGVADEA